MQSWAQRRAFPAKVGERVTTCHPFRPRLGSSRVRPVITGPDSYLVAVWPAQPAPHQWHAGQMRSKEPSRATPPEGWLTQKMSTFPRGETTPEMALRRALHSKGLRYRVHLPVPGIARRRIDIAFTRRKIAVFVDGCFWHSCPEHGRTPTRNMDWWTWKLEGNAARDRATTEHLEHLGWEVVRCWEHEPPTDMVQRVLEALDARANSDGSRRGHSAQNAQTLDAGAPIPEKLPACTTRSGSRKL